MGEGSKIEWTDHTFNPWWGCQRVSLGCERCYAETFSKRLGLKLWGPESAGTPRRFFGDKHWAEPLKWNRKAEAEGVRRRVFCASMADVFEDREDLVEHREHLFDLIDATPALDWLLLTKRPENIEHLWVGGPRANVWLGTTAEDQARANLRVPQILRNAVRAARTFVSYEPALGPVDFGPFLPIVFRPRGPGFGRGFTLDRNTLGWIIVGGESGPGARPFDLAWARSTIHACREAGVPCIVKQLGARPIDSAAPEWVDGFIRGTWTAVVPLRDRKGADMSEWPEDLRIRQFPEPRC